MHLLCIHLKRNGSSECLTGGRRLGDKDLGEVEALEYHLKDDNNVLFYVVLLNMAGS